MHFGIFGSEVQKNSFLHIIWHSVMADAQNLNLKNFMAPFYGWSSTASRLHTATSRRQFTFYHSVPWNSWYSFYRPQKDERLSWPWSHPLVLNTGSLDWESSALTTRPLLHKKIWNASRICVSSFRRGHANLLYIVPILIYMCCRSNLVRNSVTFKR